MKLLFVNLDFMNGLRKKENLYFFISSILFLVVYYKFDISLGFNPTDEGRNFAYIEKILNGKVPHKDFLHIHFIGSTILHLYQELIPEYNIQISRIQSSIFILFYTYVFLYLHPFFHKYNIFVKNILLISVSIINFHIFPLFSWPTVDGIFIFALFLYLEKKIESKYSKYTYLLLGFLPLFKFGFLLLIPVIFIRNIIFRKNIKLKNQIINFLISLIPIITYVAVIAIFGGMKDIVDLIASVSVQTTIYFDSLGLTSVMWLYNTFFVFTILQILIKKRFFSLGILTILIYIFVLEIRYFNNLGSLEINKPHIFLLVSIFLLFNFYNKKFKNYKDDFELFFLLLSIEAVSILSFGWRLSQWVYGSLLVSLLMTLSRVYQTTEYTKKINRKIFLNIQTSLIIITVLFVSIVNIQDRDKYNYRDLDNEFLIYNLNEVNRKFGNIYTNKSTYTYMENLHNCIEPLNNKNIHIFPDNSILYFLLDLKNPLPLNWHEGIREETSLDNLKTVEKIKELNYGDFPFYIVLQDNFATNLKTTKLEELNKFTGIKNFENSDKKNIIEIYKNSFIYESNICKNYEIVKVVGKSK